jgi:3-carboxy-cis,cis-muconate cycloisomerase
MTDLLWPGDERAGDLFTDAALLAAMVEVESAWLAALGAAGIAPAAPDLRGLVTADDVAGVAREAQAGGNPVIPLVRLLRTRTDDDAARWLHRGLTSQDVLDTALMLSLRDVLARVRDELAAQARTLAALAERHRTTPMAARTLTQHAVPTTFGLKAAGWLTGVLDALDDVDATRPCAQFGGSAGTLAAAAELARLAGLPDPPRRAVELAEHAARTLGLPSRPPWHTTRAPVTRLADTLARCTDGWGRIAADVLTLSRPEIGELAEATGGGSSTMPHKANPVLSVLVRRAALAAPGLAAQLHLAAADARDERPDGAWHIEWATLRTLGRRTVTAASQVTELLRGLRVDTARMQATVDAAAADLLAERRGLRDALGAPPADAADPAGYLGAADLLVDAVLHRARSVVKEGP